MKTYVITISETFPKTHSKAGLPTGFINAISNKSKKHTIRGNYALWQNRFQKIEAGEACLSVRCWTGTPYNSKQKEVFNFTHSDGIGLQKLRFEEKIMTSFEVIRKKDGAIYTPDISTLDVLSINDGLTLEDFRTWFKGYDLSQPMAIIHFTKFRYQL